MVVSPTMSYVIAAVAAVSLQLNEASAEDMRYNAVSHGFNKQLGPTRRLESYPNKDIANFDAYFDPKMETNFKKLPTQAKLAKSPWPGPILLSYLDSINAPMNDGEASPAKKYALAFGLNATDFMDRVSEADGVDSNRNFPPCTSDADCTGYQVKFYCGKRQGKTSGFCIPSTFDQSNARARAATLEDEPKCPVVHNGVTFQPNEIKSLLTYVYVDRNTLDIIPAGVIFEENVDNSTDVYGRPVDPSLRDLNPGFFHIAATNLLGIFNRSFVIDAQANLGVRLNPVRSFKVLNATAMSLKEAAKKFYNLEKYPWNSAASSIMSINSTLSWVIASNANGNLVSPGQIDHFTAAENYSYLLELDNYGGVIGGEWLGRSNGIHPDFMRFVKAKPDPNTVTGIGLRYKDVTMLLQKSLAC